MPGQPEYPVFNQPQGIPAITPSQQYPTPYGLSQGGGTAGLVDRNKIINDGVQNAINQTQQLQKMQRDTQAYKEQQASNKANAGASGIPSGAAPPSGHADFMDTVLHGLSSLGSGIKSIFSGPAPDTNAPGAGQVGPPAPLPGPAPQQGPPSPQVAQVQPQMDGGAVSAQGTVPQFMKPQVSVLAFQQGGVIPGYEGGGAIADQQGPPSPHPADAQAQLAQVIDGLHSDMHAHALGDDDQPNHSRAIPVETITPAEAKLRQQTGSTASGAAAPAAAMVDTSPTPTSTAAPAPAAQGAIPAPPPQGAPAAAPDPAIAASASAVQAVQNAPPSDPAKTGVQTTSPGAEGKPHSITPDTWNRWDDNIDKAVSLAAIAGHDPGQVRQALEANRNAYIQGHVLRYLSSAHVALQNGDMDGVEKALRNMYYYTPDGQDLKIQKQGGQLMYQDPVNPTKIDNNNVSRPNMIPVDAAHLQMLGQAFLDPMQVNKTIMEIRSSQAEVAKKAAQTQEALMTGTGNQLRGEAAVSRAGVLGSRAPSQNYKDLATGDAALIRSKAYANHVTNTFKQNRLDPQLIKGAQDAAQAFEDAAQGQKTTIPLDPTGMNPAAGKTTRDPSKSSIPGASPADIVSGKALASDIFAGGGGSVTPQRAAQLATLAHTAKRSSHPGPDGKSVADFMTDPKTGDTHVWNKALKKWEAFRLPLTSANDAANGKLGVSAGDLDDVSRAEFASNGGIPSGPEGESSQEEDDQPNAPNMVASNTDG